MFWLPLSIIALQITALKRYDFAHSFPPGRTMWGVHLFIFYPSPCLIPVRNDHLLRVTPQNMAEISLPFEVQYPTIRSWV